jgi:hypothetical protein
MESFDRETTADSSPITCHESCLVQEVRIEASANVESDSFYSAGGLPWSIMHLVVIPITFGPVIREAPDIMAQDHSSQIREPILSHITKFDGNAKKWIRQFILSPLLMIDVRVE